MPLAAYRRLDDVVSYVCTPRFTTDYALFGYKVTEVLVLRSGSCEEDSGQALAEVTAHHLLLSRKSMTLIIAPHYGGVAFRRDHMTPDVPEADILKCKAADKV